MLKGLCRTIKAEQSDCCWCGKVLIRKDIKPCAIRGRRMLHGTRTEYGKQIRKAYESHVVSEKRSNIQRLEPRNDHICNAITTVTKDYLYLAKVDRKTQGNKKMVSSRHLTRKQMRLIDLWNRKYIRQTYDNQDEIYKYLFHAKDGNDYGIFKLSPRECGRLQGVADADIDAMASVNSNSQLYKQFGNSITVSTICAIFSQLGLKGVKRWNDMTDDERNEIAHRGIRLYEDSETEEAKKYRAALELGKQPNKDI